MNEIQQSLFFWTPYELNLLVLVLRPLKYQYYLYGKPHGYSSRSDIAPEKPLDVNTSSKNIIHVDSIICKRPKISSVLIWSVAITKNTDVDLGLSVSTKNSYPQFNPRCTLTLSLLSPSLPISQYLALSFRVFCLWFTCNDFS